jgi:DNA-binding IclR family transcriptional regulator
MVNAFLDKTADRTRQLCKAGIPSGSRTKVVRHTANGGVSVGSRVGLILPISVCISVAPQVLSLSFKGTSARA